MTDFLAKLGKKNDCIRIVVGSSQGAPAWWCVEVEKLSLPIYAKDVRHEQIDLSKYGKVLRKGWGSWPPAQVVAELEEKYGVKLKAKPH